MATKGNIISKANCTNGSVCKAWSGSHDSGTSWDSSVWYICAPVWRISYYVNKNWGSWGRTIAWNFWRWENNAFVKDATWTDTWGQTSAGHWTHWFRHNSPDGGNGDFYNHVVGKPLCDLWKFRTNGSELYLKNIDIYVDYIGRMRDDYYNEWRGKPICSNGSMSSFVKYGGTDAEAVEYFRNSKFRGSPILAGQEQFMVATNNYR